MKIKINDDKVLVEKIRAELRENNNYCPCSIVHNKDTKCMCKDFREQESGECHCGLYIKISDD